MSYDPAIPLLGTCLEKVLIFGFSSSEWGSSDAHSLAACTDLQDLRLNVSTWPYRGGVELSGQEEVSQCWGHKDLPCARVSALLQLAMLKFQRIKCFYLLKNIRYYKCNKLHVFLCLWVKNSALPRILTQNQQLALNSLLMHIWSIFVSVQAIRWDTIF